MASFFGQGDFGTRFDWGLAGATVTQPDIAVVVDVLSFSTSVTVAVERGMQVLPLSWRGQRAAEFAATHDASLAVGRLEATRDDAVPAPSLSPASLLRCEATRRLVLPSPNGSTIAHSLDDTEAVVLAGCLRNSDAVATWLLPAAQAGRSIAVIAAGERWSHDDSLRPALEDHLGAGATLSAMVRLGHSTGFSPEAAAAAQLYDAVAENLPQTLRNCVGGRELSSKGFAADVHVAADLNASSVVPVMVEGAFQVSGTWSEVIGA